MSEWFFERSGCPFCGDPDGPVRVTIRYRDTAERSPLIPDVEGALRECVPCGIAWSTHGCRLDAFTAFYAKSLGDLTHLDQSLLQRVRVALMRSMTSGSAVGTLLDRLTLRVFHVPELLRAPRGLDVLDVGAGFGELLHIFQDLGNRVAGTEVVPDLVRLLRARGFTCHEGELETADFGARRFDLALFRAVFYRTLDPARTLRFARDLLAPGGQIALVDPCPTAEGLPYFARKHFPQGHFYVVDPTRYLAMLDEKFALRAPAWHVEYGRPEALLRPARTGGNLIAAAEMLTFNLLRQKPYFLSYALVAR